MTVISPQEKPALGVILGDATGIGPELVAKIVADGFLDGECRPILIGDKRVLEMGMKTAGVSFPVRAIASADEARFDQGAQILDMKDLDPVSIVVGEVSPACGKACGDAIVKAIELFKAGAIEGFVFAPFNKTALKKGGYNYESEHALFAHYFGIPLLYGEINALDGIMTSRVTSHIPIKDVSAGLTSENIGKAIALIHDTLNLFGNDRPRVAVAALNPHAGENGTCGREEIDVIAPAVAEARAAGMNVSGPFSADTVFVRAFNGDFDAVVTMFHDQGQIALKLRGLERGVTIAGGFPAPIATPAHGTAYDIVGKNVAKTEAIKNAVRMAARAALSSRTAARK